ncbi:MAG: diaminopimelate decarboxylase [Gemmatimonadota bacterium]
MPAKSTNPYAATRAPAAKPLPFSQRQMQEILAEYPTPLFVYHERGIRESGRRLKAAFLWNSGFREYFAAKALPNPNILALLSSEGFGVDASSLPELQAAAAAGIPGDEVMFTSNNTPVREFREAKERGAILNLDDITHLDILLEEAGGLPELLSFRLNPGSTRTGNQIIGDPVEAKFGMTRAQIFEGITRAREEGVRHFGLHTMIASNELDPSYFVDTSEMLFELAADLASLTGVKVQFVNLGGGIGIPYEPDQLPVDIEAIGRGVRERYDAIIRPAGLHPLAVYMENGRYVTGPHGYLLTTVTTLKETFKKFVGVDATMADVMRPAVYGAYHHISVPGKDRVPPYWVADVVGSLCENNDKFAIDRRLPPVERGDVLVIHDVGAHGHAMGFNYNGKLRSAEVLLREDGSILPLRRAETAREYFATVNWDSLKVLRREIGTQLANLISDLGEASGHISGIIHPSLPEGPAH